MQRCEFCRVELPENPVCCPLCKHKSDENEGPGAPRFPVLPEEPNATRKFFAWFTFVSLCAAAVCPAVNLLLPNGGRWSFYAVAGLATLWADMAVLLKKRKNPAKSLLWQSTFVSVAAFLWDRFTGKLGWSVDYVFPVLCSAVTVTLWIFAKIKSPGTRGNLGYAVLSCLGGSLCFIKVLLGFGHTQIPAVTAAVIAAVILAAMIVFDGKALHSELQRRFHL